MGREISGVSNSFKGLDSSLSDYGSIRLWTYPYLRLFVSSPKHNPDLCQFIWVRIQIEKEYSAFKRQKK